MDVLSFAKEDDDERQLYIRWIQGYDREMSFKDFTNKAINKPKPARNHKEESEADILTKVSKILEMR